MKRKFLVDADYADKITIVSNIFVFTKITNFKGVRMSAVKINKEDVVGLYRQLANYEVGQINLSEMGDWLKNKNSPFAAKVINDNFQIIHKVARNSSESQFLDFIMVGELPATKLTDKEMEALKGGLTPWVPYAIYAAAYIIYDMSKGH